MKVALLSLLLLACCGPRPEDHPPIAADSYPWEWRDLSELGGGDFMWQQSIDAKFGPRSMHLEAVLQKKGDTMVLVGLTPFGSKAFALTLRGKEVSFESFVDQQPPFPPTFMMIDVQRAYWPIGKAPDESAEASAIHSEQGGEKVVESFRLGRLDWRTYQREGQREDGKPYQGGIEIRYDDWQDGVARKVTIKNDWFGYTMDIRTTSAQRL